MEWHRRTTIIHISVWGLAPHTALARVLQGGQGRSDGASGPAQISGLTDC